MRRVWEPTVWDCINYSVASVCFGDFIGHPGAQNHSEERIRAEMLGMRYLAYRRNLSTVWCLEVLWDCWEGPDCSEQAFSPATLTAREPSLGDTTTQDSSEAD